MSSKRIKTIVYTVALVLAFSSHAFASEKYTANECFEKFSRGTLKFNQTLDKAIFKPVAKGYRALPVPIRTGSSNFIENLRSLLKSVLTLKILAFTSASTFWFLDSLLFSSKIILKARSLNN